MDVDKVARAMGASQAQADAIAEACVKCKIIGVLQQSGFIGQMYVESAGFTAKRESMNYAVDKLQAVFGSARITKGQAWAYGRIDQGVRDRTGVKTPDRPADQRAIANIVYGGEWGRSHLGNTQPNDGWDFRGGGEKQLTGRDNFTRFSKAYFGDDRLARNPSLIESLPTSIAAGGWFWMVNSLGQYADKKDWLALSRGVNLGDPRSSATPKAYPERVAATNKALAFSGASQ